MSRLKAPRVRALQLAAIIIAVASLRTIVAVVSFLWPVSWQHKLWLGLVSHSPLAACSSPPMKRDQHRGRDHVSQTLALPGRWDGFDSILEQTNRSVRAPSVVRDVVNHGLGRVRRGKKISEARAAARHGPAAAAAPAQCHDISTAAGRSVQPASTK